MSSLKRKRADNTADIRVYVGKENEDPYCKSPRRKQGKMAESQSPPRTALSVKNQNGRQPLVISEKTFSERSSNYSTHKKMGICANERDKKNGQSEVSAHLPHPGVGGSPIRPHNKEDQDPKQLLHREKKILDENHGTHSPRTPRVDDCFPKMYKKGSPRNKGENTKRSSGSILDYTCESTEGLNKVSDIHMMLLERSKSVCKIDVTGAESIQGTGFVLVDNLIMTCAHLFRDFLEGKKLKEGTNVSVLFNFHGPQPITNNFVFTVEKIIVAISEDLDYILLKLKPNLNRRVPPGLLELFGPLTENGKIFIIGHPRGEAKTTVFTFITQLENREQAIHDHLAPYKDNIFIRLSIIQIIEDQGIQNVINGVKANQVETYITSEMYEGTSGSPGLNSDGQLTLMHTGGYGYGFPHMIHTVFEYGQRLDLIIQDVVRQLKESGNEQLLETIESVASKNEHLFKVLEAEPMEVD